MGPKRALIRKGTLATTLLLAIGSSWSSEAANAPRARSHTARPVPSAPKTFDPATDHLPANFSGADIAAVFAANLVRPKGEYETTEAYRLRAPKGGETYAIRFQPEDVHYIADAQSFSITPRRDTVYKDDSLYSVSTDESALVVRDTDKNTGQYVASNAMGAKVRVMKDHETQYSLVIAKSWSGPSDEFAVRIEASKAAAIRKRLSFLYVARLAATGPIGVARSVTIHIEPGMSHPLERTITNNYLWTDAASVWVYDSGSGEILAKQTILAAPSHD